jgi:hypothetical protein
MLSDLTVARNSDGHLELFVLAADRQLQYVMHIWQQSPNGPWVSATTIQPPGHVYNFMAGTEALPVGGGKPASFTVGTLQAFKPGVTNDTATSVVTNVASICKLPSSGAGEGEPAGFALDRSHPDRPRFQEKGASVIQPVVRPI